MAQKEVIIIGGGLAGLTSAIHLSRAGREVTLFEKNSFPKHKVCGEYISNEILPYFSSLGIDLEHVRPVKISRALVSSVSGKTASCTLPLGGFGISRYTLDRLLYEKAVSSGCTVIEETVSEVAFNNETFTLKTSNNQVYESKAVIGAFGKRSNIDVHMTRDFIIAKSPWLAVKAHYTGTFDDDAVALHNFEGGYCGVSKVEDGIINICYLADFESFRKYKNVEDYRKNVVCRNPHLKKIFESCTMVFEKPLTISQVSFAQKKSVEHNMLMTGDTAGLIHPLCGNGMAIAVRSAKLASELTEQFLSSEIDRKTMEDQYTAEWKKLFGRRMFAGRILSKIAQHPTASDIFMGAVTRIPALLPTIIKATHGKPFTA